MIATYPRDRARYASLENPFTKQLILSSRSSNTHCLPKSTLKIADGLVTAGFCEILREKTGGQWQNFSVASQPHTPAPDDGPVELPPPPDPAHVRARSTADEVASARWYQLLPRRLSGGEYEPYRFRQERDYVFRETTAVLIRCLPPAEAAEIAWYATTTGFYSAVAAIEADDW